MPATAAKSPGASLHVALVAAVAAVGGLLFGYDTGVISGAILYIKRDFPLSDLGQGLIVSAVTAGALVGAFAAGPLTQRLGRRPTNLAAGVLFLIASVLSALAAGEWTLIAGRLLVGAGVGFTSVAAPMYIAEAAPAEARGSLVSGFQLAITVGILVAYLVDAALAAAGNWRWMLGLGALPGALLAAGMLFLPESPRWLVEVGREEEAREVLSSLRGGGGVEVELTQIRDEIRRGGGQGSWSDLLGREVRPALLVGVALAVIQQVTGINAIIYYAPQIFAGAGFSSDSTALAATIGIGVINVAATFIAIGLVDRAGRKPLLIAGLLGMIGSLAVLAVAFGERAAGGADEGMLGWITVACVALYIVSFAFSLGPVVWLMIAEIYPTRVRAAAMAVSTAANWGANFAVSLSFPLLTASLGSAFVFTLYALLGVASLAFIAWRVPETKNRTLEEIAALWR